MIEAPHLEPPIRGLFHSRRRHERRLLAWGARAVAYGQQVAAERDEARKRLRGAREELRYWNDRRSLLDDAGTVTREARERADEIERQARERADELERRAREHAVHLVEHVHEEADRILQHARDEAGLLRERTQRSLASSQTQVDQLRAVQIAVTHTVRSALHSFEDGLAELESAAPARTFLPRIEVGDIPAIEHVALHAPRAVALPVSVAPITADVERPAFFTRPSLLDVTREATVLQADTSAPARPAHGANPDAKWTLRT